MTWVLESVDEACCAFTAATKVVKLLFEVAVSCSRGRNSEHGKRSNRVAIDRHCLFSCLAPTHTGQERQEGGRRALLRSSLASLKPFQSAALDDPIAWAERIAGLTLDPWQRDVLRSAAPRLLLTK
jgi:hypothetical protein